MALPFTRRAALLGTAGMLGGCETLDSILGERRETIVGERRPVLQTPARRLTPDPALASTAVNLPAPQPREQWPQAGGTVAHAGGHPALGTSFREAWRSGFGSGSGYRRRITSGPIVADGTVYTVDAYGVAMAFALDTGNRRWRRDTAPANESAGQVGGGVAFEGGVLYSATGLAEIMALDPADGSVKWRARMPAPARGAPAVAGGRIFVPTVENHLVAFSIEDGRRLWTHRAQTVATIPLGLPTPAVEGDLVVCGFASGELSAVRASDGRVTWSESLAAANRGTLSEVSGIRAMPAVGEGRVVALGMGGLTICIDLRSGRRLWEREVGGTEGAWIAGDWVFLVTAEEQLACLGRDDGRVRWATDLRPPARGRRAPPSNSWCPPILAGGRVLIAGSGEELLSVDPATGEIVARRDLPGAVSWQPAVVGDLLLVATENSYLVALRGA